MLSISAVDQNSQLFIQKARHLKSFGSVCGPCMGKAHLFIYSTGSGPEMQMLSLVHSCEFVYMCVSAGEGGEGTSFVLGNSPPLLEL